MATTQKKKPSTKKPPATQTVEEKGKPTQTKPQRLSKEEAARLAEMEENRRARKREQRKHFSEQYMPYILGALGFLFAVFFVMNALNTGGTADTHPAGPFGYYFCQVFFGLLGWTAFFIPVLLFYLTAFWRKNCREGTVALRSVLTLVLIILLSSVVHAFVCNGNPDMAKLDIKMLYSTGAIYQSGGVIGGVLGLGLFKLLKIWGTVVIAVVVLPLLIMVLIGVTPAYVAMKMKERIKAAKEAREERDIEAARDALDHPEKPQDKPRRQVKSAPVDDEDDEYHPPKKPTTQTTRDQHDNDTVVKVDTATGEVIEDDEDEEEQQPRKPQRKQEPPADVQGKPTTQQQNDRQPDRQADRQTDRQDDQNDQDDDNADYVPHVRNRKEPATQERKEPQQVAEKPQETTQKPARPERTQTAAEDTPDRDQRVDSHDEEDGELYLPHRPNARDRRSKRGEQAQPATRRPVYQDDEFYADDLPDETETMEVSLDEEDAELVIPARRKPQTSAQETTTQKPPVQEPPAQPVQPAQPAQPAQPTQPVQTEKERIVVVVHEQDRTAITSTSTNHVDGLAEEEVVLPSGGGEAGVSAKNEYCFPPIDLMVRGSDRYEADEDEITRNIETLREVLESFHIRVKEVACSCGPTITRYEVKPDQGVRVRSIANLVDDIAMGLAKSGVRIEAPIPGKAAVGIEVPNEHPATVYLRNLIETPEFRQHKSPIASCLGADVSGRPVIFDINKMPHLLVAGATGMGKSVCINSIIMSILYKATPEEVKLILIDPKKVEFTMYRDLPHLYAPIVSDPKKAAGCLNSAVNEMERRFELIEEEGVRNIAGYNEVIAGDPTKKPMPRIVIIIDEFADLMMTASQEVETAVCRLAQKARAAGIHLIIGTQRPSVDVITGLIKANIPSRIAFTVASARDSMTILDMGGADKLIGRGDMLYAPVGASKPMRVQGTFVSDGEVERVVTYIKEHNREVVFDEGFVKDIEVEAAKCGNSGKKKGGEAASDFDALGGGDEGDDKYWAAVEVAVEAQKISTSLLQRRLNLGYGRAAKIIDRMEEMGFVGPADGNKPRKLLITKQDLAEIRISGRTESDEE